ncbi:hypothetical protein SAMN05192574_102243 [Mucilaginibacter gossypiicola]|uniref:Uncharacterized protein n=1 Tax=Mucilaginibacter gossypiicola TaxID=551995 RepID=A0A1H8D7S5_9SPHI|nr:hypothetical protein [Mucilaginibacter gossypiicola]SEN03299.1 hypothetical protein SAMN05192574_102243 [Mucilaginibacter gossypiicola]
MKVGPELLKILNKPFPAEQFIHQRFGRYDLAFKTDVQGRPVLLFMGIADADGNIKGERFARRLITGKDGKIIKDHWDNKGKA